MKVKSIILMVVLFSILSGCGIGATNYEVFSHLNDGIVERKLPFRLLVKGYIKEKFNEEFNIYIRSNYKRKVSEKCVYGFLTKKSDPKQRAIAWIVLSGKEYCKKQQKWILSF